MSDDNPYRAPVSAITPEERRRRRPIGPILAGLVAMILATIWAGSFGLLASVLAVSSWWAYKFWPRPAAPVAPEARDFLRRLEGAGPGEVASAEPAKSTTSEPVGDVLGDLRF